MLALLLASLGGAYALTTARAGSNSTGPGNGRVATGLQLQVMGIELVVPPTWRRDTAQERVLIERTQAKTVAAMFDSQRPTRKLSIIRARMGVSPEDALKRAIGVLIPEASRQTLRHVTPNPHGLRLSTLVGRQYIGYSQPDSNQPAEVYIIAVLTRDGQDYWVLMMTDRSEASDEKSVATAVEGDVAVFQNILRSTRLQPATPPPDEKDSP